MDTLKQVYNSNSNSIEIAKNVNKFRLSNKNKWFQICFEHETLGTQYYLKIYNTWVQITQVNRIDTSMDNKPSEFLENIKNGIDFLISKY
jgi:hypothetical protein